MSETNSLYYRKFSPEKALEQVVKYGWVMKDEMTTRSEHDLLIPDGYVEIIFVLNGAYYKEDIHKKRAMTTINQSCVVGLQSTSVLASRTDQCYLVGLKLFPWGAYRLFGEQLQNTTDTNIDIHDFGATWLCKLNDGLCPGLEETAIISRINTALCHQIEQQKANTAWKVAKSYLNTILEVNGQLTVKDIAQKHHVSMRHLQRKFKQYYGLSPKKLINIIRFKQLYKASVLQQKLPNDFLDFGYYDQMHFIKDFRKHMGVLPSKTKDITFLKLNKMAKINS
ncbi:MAG: helix-turn-helix transcriptional regulator [Bacteroidota bacterium]